MKYKVELAEFHTIEIEAKSREEAENKAAVMDDDEILSKSAGHAEMVIWDSWECL